MVIIYYYSYATLLTLINGSWYYNCSFCCMFVSGGGVILYNSYHNICATGLWLLRVHSPGQSSKAPRIWSLGTPENPSDHIPGTSGRRGETSLKKCEISKNEAKKSMRNTVVKVHAPLYCSNGLILLYNILYILISLGCLQTWKNWVICKRGVPPLVNTVLHLLSFSLKKER